MSRITLAASLLLAIPSSSFAQQARALTASADTGPVTAEIFETKDAAALTVGQRLAQLLVQEGEGHDGKPASEHARRQHRRFGQSNYRQIEKLARAIDVSAPADGLQPVAQLAQPDDELGRCRQERHPDVADHPLAVDQEREGAPGCSIDGLFRMLQQLEREPASNARLLEFWHACLAMGFEGRYRVPVASGGSVVAGQTHTVVLLEAS